VSSYQLPTRGAIGSQVGTGQGRPAAALTAIPTRDGGRARFEELVARSGRVEVGGVVVVMVAGLEDIIAPKEWANRPKHREALVELRTLRDR